MAEDVRIVWDDKAVYDLLNSADGPVGELILELSERAAAVAKSVVRVRTQRGGSTARPPGFTKASIKVHFPAWGSLGLLYGGVNASADPTIFLEYPASQMTQSYPFLTMGLFSLEGQV
jgi:hypothetical protein